MKRKIIVIYLVVTILCPVLSGLNGCRKTTGKIHIEAGEFTARINGLTLWYKVSGTGPICILPTPGWGPSSELYFLKFTPLEEMFTMVYLDTRGSGRSQRPKLNEFSMSNFIADIEELRKHLGVETIWLMGHSDGSPMILNYACKYADRVEGLILVDAPTGDTSQDNERIIRMQSRKNEPWFETAFNAFEQMPTTQKEFEDINKAMMPLFFSSIENLKKNREVFDKTSLSFQAFQGRGQSDRSSADIATCLPGLKIPTLIIVGSDDFICTPSAAEYLHRELAHSKLLIIEKAGHFPWLEQPEQFFTGIRTFLSKLGYHRN